MRGSKKQVTVGGIVMGGGTPVSIQSMLSAPSGDIEANLMQAVELERAGCEIIRVAVPTRESTRLIDALKREVRMPVVADIHFDYRLALESVAAGADKIRLNPGNIGGEDRVRQVARVCGQKGIPIRIGVNAGSLERELLAKYGGPTPQAMLDSALRHAAMLERFDFDDIVLSLKSSDVGDTISAYRLAAQRTTYPLHLGITHTGTARIGLLKSAVGIGGLLLDGIGDTIRASLTASPSEEVSAARDILKSVGLGQGPTVISCPTCGRCRIDLIPLAEQVEAALAGRTESITVAVMGCAVNGPGEARHADVGVAGGDGCGVIFGNGKIIEKVPQDEILSALLRSIDRVAEQ